MILKFSPPIISPRLIPPRFREFPATVLSPVFNNDEASNFPGTIRPFSKFATEEILPLPPDNNCPIAAEPNPDTNASLDGASMVNFPFKAVPNTLDNPGICNKDEMVDNVLLPVNAESNGDPAFSSAVVPLLQLMVDIEMLSTTSAIRKQKFFI